MPLLPQTFVRFDPPVRLDLKTVHRRHSSVTPNSAPVLRYFPSLPLIITMDAPRRTISAQLPPIPKALVIYTGADFPSAAADTMEEHAERVKSILGIEPSAVLQAMLDSDPLPPLPPRIPREIQNWRAKAVLSQMGLLAQVEAAIATMEEPEKTVVTLAWNGDAKLARKGPTVLGMAAALGLTDEQVDALFIAAEAINI